MQHRVTSKIQRALGRVDAHLGTELNAGLDVALSLPRRVAAHPLDRARIALAAVLLSTDRVDRTLRLRVRGVEEPMSFRVPDWAAMRVLEEVFVKGEYDIVLPRPPRAILDLGSNIGASILYFAWRYPNARIIGVEPSRELFPILRANVGALPNVTLHNAAISAASGEVEFREGDASWSGSTQVGAAGGPERYVVPAVGLDELLARQPIDLVKFDVEGAEFDVLPASRRLTEVMAILGEIHARPGTPQTESILSLFSDYAIHLGPADWTGGWFTNFSAVRRRTAMPTS